MDRRVPPLVSSSRRRRRVRRIRSQRGSQACAPGQRLCLRDHLIRRGWWGRETTSQISPSSCPRSVFLYELRMPIAPAPRASPFFKWSGCRLGSSGSVKRRPNPSADSCASKCARRDQASSRGYIARRRARRARLTSRGPGPRRRSRHFITPRIGRHRPCRRANSDDFNGFR